MIIELISKKCLDMQTKICKWVGCQRVLPGEIDKQSKQYDLH